MQLHEPTFSKDWFVGNVPQWRSMLSEFCDQPNLRFLEIGAFEGRATFWLLSNILTHPSSAIVCIDTFQEGLCNYEIAEQEGADLGRSSSKDKANVDLQGPDSNRNAATDLESAEPTTEGQSIGSQYEVFMSNIAPFREKVTVQVGFSQELLRQHELSSYDFIYIDGSHNASDVLEDAVLSFRLLKPDGIMVFDDYEWSACEGTLKHPRKGIDAFLEIYDKQYNLISKGYQVAVRKL